MKDSSWHWETSYLRAVESAPSSRQSNISKRSQLNTIDIDGAQPRPFSKATELCLPNFHSTLDIEGGQPRKLIPTVVNKPNDRNLRNDDIEHSRPYVNRMITNRVVDPLNPDYMLPSTSIRAITPPKFLRETNRVQDINNDPDYPTLKKPSEFATRNHMDYKDAVGTQTAVARLKPRHSKHFGPLEVTDINNDSIFRTRRVGNPLSPRYTYDTPQEMNENCSNNHNIGVIAGNHPRRLPPMRNDRPLLSLKTDDIENMKRTVLHFVPPSFPVNRRQYRQINNIDDIEKVHPSNKFTTFAKTTQRSTNPLNPVYKF